MIFILVIGIKKNSTVMVLISILLTLVIGLMVICRVKGHYTTSSSTIYHGNFSNKDLDGYGTFNTDKGEIYTGECKDDVRHGPGKLITSEGEIFKRLFHDGEYIGLSSAYRG